MPVACRWLCLQTRVVSQPLTAAFCPGLLPLPAMHTGKNCSTSVASASLTLQSGTAQTITAGNTIFTNNGAWMSSRLNLTLTTPIQYDSVANATLCLTLRSPCANIFALCHYGNRTSCGTFVSIEAYRQRANCCEFRAGSSSAHCTADMFVPACVVDRKKVTANDTTAVLPVLRRCGLQPSLQCGCADADVCMRCAQFPTATTA